MVVSRRNKGGGKQEKEKLVFDKVLRAFFFDAYIELRTLKG